MSQLTGENLIGYGTAAGSGAPIQAINPATDETLSPAYHAVSAEDFDRALDLAWKAFLDYRQRSDEERAQFLDAIAEEIEARADAITERGVAETGLPVARLQGERGRTVGQLRLFASVLREGKYRDVRHDPALPERQPLPRADLRYQKIGLGPVAVFGASNFPLAFSVAGGDTASALAAGCPVVFKAHNAHPGLSELVGRAVVAAAKRTGMPEGVFSLLYGRGNDIGQKLAAHPHIQAVGFTGSRGGGTALMKTAFERPVPIPVYAEMSSINPVYLLPEALKARGAAIGQELVQSMLMGAGQFCTSPGLIFALKGEGFEAFVEAAKDAIAAAAPQTMLNPGIAKSFNAGVAKLEGLSEVDHISAGAETSGPNQCRAQLFLAEAKDIVGSVALETEVFGSSSVIVACDTIEQIYALTESLEGQLTASVHSTADDDVAVLKTLLALLERKVGRILFNGFGTGVEVCSAMVHGGPYPSTSDGRSTSVGTAAIDRFLRPVCYQNVPENLLPAALQNL